MDIHAKSVDMDMDGKFDTRGNPDNNNLLLSTHSECNLLYIIY